MDTMFPTAWQFDYSYDGGEKSCSTLICDLRDFFRTLPHEVIVGVRAYDSGAVIDIPAWCWSTGNTLLVKEHPFYLIKTKPKREKSDE